VVRLADGQAHEPGGNAINAIPFLYQVVDKREALVVQSPNGEGGDASLLCAPLVIRGAVFGVLTVRRKKYTGIFTSKDVHYIVSLTKRASLNLENKLLYESLFANVLDTFQSLVACVQMRDNYTQEHCRRVTKVSIRTAEVLGLDLQDRECLKVAGVLHDVGKIAIPDGILLKPGRLTCGEFEIMKRHPSIGVQLLEGLEPSLFEIAIPDAVLLKPGRLTDEEYEIIKQHPALGENILKPIALFDREREIILHHHERWDGKGYPSGLAGTDIPFLSRIIAVVDTFDAMTNNRPYRRALDVGTALEEIRRNRGTQFDPDVADAFLSLY
jgi:HD-GYP domain-containing protein (c-di-GMP phosphodiesterase class II)